MMKSTLVLLFIAVVLFLPTTAVLVAQDNSYTHLGLEAFKTYVGGDIDKVLPFNGNLYLNIPLASFPEKGGHPLTFFLQSNAGSWQLEEYCDSLGDCFFTYSNTPSPLHGAYTIGGISSPIGFGTSIDVSSVDVTYAYISPGYIAPGDSTTCSSTSPNSCAEPFSYEAVVTDATEARHTMDLDTTSNLFRSDDGTGYVQSSTLSTSTIPLTDADGIKYIQASNGRLTVIDPNGNTIQRQGGLITDTVNRPIPDTNGLSTNTGTAGCPTLGIPNEPVTSSASWTVPSINGSSVTYLFCYTSIIVNTKFYLPPTSNTSFGSQVVDLSIGAIQSVVLPDRTYWSFVYDTTSTSHVYAYGDLLTINYPTGGSISYEYNNNDWTPGRYSTRFVTARTVTDANGNMGRWSYVTALSGAPGTTAKITDPDNNDTVILYDENHNEDTSIPVETDKKYYQGKASANILLRDESTQYQWPAFPSSSYFPNSITTTTPAGASTRTIGYDAQSVNQVYACYYSLINGQNYRCASPFQATIPFEMPTSVSVTNYDGQQLKNTSTRRQANPLGLATQPAGNVYYLANLLNLTNSSTTSDPTSAFETSYGYDEPTLGPNCYCGNQTSRSAVDVTGVAPSNRWTTQYNSAGMPIASTDANTTAATGYPGGTTSYGYGSLGLFVATTAYPTTQGVTHTEGENRDDATGLTISATDQNLQPTQYFYYPPGQPDATKVQRVSLPDGASVSFTYNDTPGSASVTTTAATDASADEISVRTSYVDGLGRLISETKNDSYCSVQVITVDTVYDILGRVIGKSDPYCIKGEATYDLISYQYDALGRVLIEGHSDGSSRQWCYDGQQILQQQTICQTRVAGVAGQWVDSSDENGNVHQYVYDALGRLTAVSEPSVTGGGNAMLTSYSYNSLDRLIGVQQGQGSTGEERTFVYDQFGRLHSSWNPESNLITYSVYDPNGNVLTKTDARGVSTSYGYDALNRITSKTYTGSNAVAQATASFTPSSCFQYDTNAATHTGGNLIGRVTNEWTILGPCSASVPAGGYRTLRSKLTYDALGRLQTETQCTPVNCNTNTPYSLTRGYDYAGNITLYTNGFGSIAFTQKYDGASRLLNVWSTWVDSSHPAGLFTANSYNPFAITRYTLGSTVFVSNTYDSRMRVAGEVVTSQ